MFYLAHQRTIAAFDRYIEWRYQRGAGTALDRREYRGLMPRTRLILTQKGSAFELSVKRRVNFDGEAVEYLAADSLQSYVTGLYRAADRRDLCPVRNTGARSIQRRRLEDVAALPGYWRDLASVASALGKRLGTCAWTALVGRCSRAIPVRLR